MELNVAFEFIQHHEIIGSPLNYENIRNNLPVPRVIMKLNIWAILKEAVGKDLSKFSMPGNFSFYIYFFFYLYFYFYLINLPYSLAKRTTFNDSKTM